MSGWRTAIIQERASVSIRDQQLISAGKTETRIPLEQLRQVLVLSTGAVLSAAALTAAAKENVHMLFCGDKYTPVCELIPLGQHHEAAGAVMDQAQWNQVSKDLVWKSIVELKLKNQLALLQALHRDPPPRFRDFILTVEPGDSTNREAVTARIYFRSLFGTHFRRHASDDLNSKLNYGYTILCSAFTRCLAMHGYHTGLGIHHCSRDNPVNLSCDLMEAFRPFVDQIVYESGDAPLDWELKKRLISLPSNSCMMEGQRMNLDTAIENYTLETLEAVRRGTAEVPEVSF